MMTTDKTFQSPPSRLRRAASVGVAARSIQTQTAKGEAFVEEFKADIA